MWIVYECVVVAVGIGHRACKSLKLFGCQTQPWQKTIPRWQPKPLGINPFLPQKVPFLGTPPPLYLLLSNTHSDNKCILNIYSLNPIIYRGKSGSLASSMTLLRFVLPGPVAGAGCLPDF